MWLAGGLSLGKTSSKPLLLNKWRKLLPPTPPPPRPPPPIFPCWPSPPPPPPSASSLSACQETLSSYASSVQKKAETSEQTLAVLLVRALRNTPPQIWVLISEAQPQTTTKNLQMNETGPAVRHIFSMRWRWGRITLVWQKALDLQLRSTSEMSQSERRSVALGVEQECPGKLTTNRHQEVEREWSTEWRSRSRNLSLSVAHLLTGDWSFR